MVTFLFNADLGSTLENRIEPEAVEAVSVVSAALPAQSPRRMTRLGNGCLWMASVELARGIKGSYWFRLEAENGAKTATIDLPDALNPDTLDIQWIERGRVRVSVLDTLDGAGSDHDWWTAEPGPLPGQLDELQHSSASMGLERRLWIYTSAAARGQKAELLVVFDGDAYLDGVSVPLTLESLIAAGRIPPMVAVLVESPRPVRISDLWNNPVFAAMLVDEVLPLVRSRYDVSDSPATAVGASAGGLGAAFVALQHPDRFSRAVSLSGAFWRPAHRPEGDLSEFEETEEWGWLTHQYATRARAAIRLHLAVGINETRTGRGQHRPPILWANRQLRDVLIAKGYDFTYTEYLGGHDPICWREELGRGLAAVYA